jgi:hypothetical protein
VSRRAVSRRARKWRSLDDADMSVLPSVAVEIAVAQPDALGIDGTLEGRILAAMVAGWGDRRDTTWRGDVQSSGAGVTTGDLAAYLRMVPYSAERQQLSGALTYLRRHGLLHFEYDRLNDAQITWWVTDRGREAASGVRH